jgi:hypothetical protein
MPTTNEMQRLHDGGMSVTTLAWWLLEESTWCPFCLQGYAWELHVACVGCDRPTCPLCADHDHDGGPHCPECAHEAATPAPPKEASS